MDKHLDDEYMDLALAEARKAGAAGEVPVGAIIVADGAVIGRGFNQPISLHDPTAHAEILAMREAARSAGNYRLAGASLYCTIEPCTMCAGAMIHARIARLVFGTPDPKAGAAGSIYNIVTDPRLNHRIAVVFGIRDTESASLLREFFATRRM
ncbi:MAG: tRNA adenosine(34) deaminase TadA [Acidobacteria bacterium]|nr:tRNA adenosine(34) deaminase TadA [Acidobacteriota bacterium]